MPIRRKKMHKHVKRTLNCQADCLIGHFAAKTMQQPAARVGVCSLTFHQSLLCRGPSVEHMLPFRTANNLVLRLHGDTKDFEITWMNATAGSPVSDLMGENVLEYFASNFS